MTALLVTGTGGWPLKCKSGVDGRPLFALRSSRSKSGVLGVLGDLDDKSMSGVLGNSLSFRGLDSFSGWHRVSSIKSSGGDGGGVGAVSTAAGLLAATKRERLSNSATSLELDPE